MDRKEFENDLLSGNVTEKYLSLSKEELKERFGEEFLKTVEFGNQNNNHHQYELFEHILRMVDSISTEGISNEDLIKVKVAAFFHDIGKPYVAALNEKTGQTQFIGHAKESANMAKGILANIGYNQEEIDELGFLIQCHDDFIPIGKKEDATPERISKIFASMKKKLENYCPTISDMKKLIVLCKADAMAQNEVIKKNDEIVDTREDRISRLVAIEEVLPEAIVLKEKQEIEKLNQQKETLQNGPKPIEKKGKIVNQKQIDLWNAKTDEQKQTEMNEIDEKIADLNKEKERLLEVDEKTRNLSEVVDVTSKLNKNKLNIPYYQVAKSALMNWNGLSEEEAMKTIQQSSFEEVEGQVWAKGSMDYAIENILSKVELSEEQKDRFTKAIYGELGDSSILEDVGAKLSEKNNEKVIMETLFAVHDGWVKDNSKKFFARDKKYQHLPSELIGWDEVKADLLFVKSIYDSMGIEVDEEKLEEKYNKTVKTFKDKKGIHTDVDLIHEINKGAEFYPALEGQDEILYALSKSAYVSTFILKKGIGEILEENSEIFDPENEKFSIEKMNNFLDEFKSYDIIDDERLNLSIGDKEKCLENIVNVSSVYWNIRDKYYGKVYKQFGNPMMDYEVIEYAHPETQYGIAYKDIIDNAEHKACITLYDEMRKAKAHIEEVKEENEKIKFENVALTDELQELNRKDIAIENFKAMIKDRKNIQKQNETLKVEIDKIQSKEEK